MGCQNISSVPSKQVSGCPAPATATQTVPFLTAGSGYGRTSCSRLVTSWNHNPLFLLFSPHLYKAFYQPYSVLCAQDSMSNKTRFFPTRSSSFNGNFKQIKTGLLHVQQKTGCLARPALPSPSLMSEQRGVYAEPHTDIYPTALLPPHPAQHLLLLPTSPRSLPGPLPRTSVPLLRTLGSCILGFASLLGGAGDGGDIHWSVPQAALY